MASEDWRNYAACEGPQHYTRERPPWQYNAPATLRLPLTCWVVRHIPTGRLFPATRPRRGMTWQEPIDPAFEAPRLWHSRGAALRSLATWLKGGRMVTEAEQWDEEGVHRPAVMGVVEMEHRVREEFEAVKVVVGEVA